MWLQENERPRWNIDVAVLSFHFKFLSMAARPKPVDQYPGTVAASEGS